MRNLLLVAVLGCVFAGLMLATPASAQAPVAEWLFDNDIDGFGTRDQGAQLTSATDADVVREEGNGVLQFAYTPTKGAPTGLGTGLNAGLLGGKSLLMHIRTTAQTTVRVGINEADASSYSTEFTSLPGRWQEVVLDFSEFTLADGSADQNDRLDLDQAALIFFTDNVGTLAALADAVPFFIAPDLSPRKLWLDDVWVDSEGTPPRWVRTEAGLQVDSFESAPLQWAGIAGSDTEIAYEQERKADGDYSLRIAYNLPPGKLAVWGTGLGTVPLEGMTRLRLSYLSEVETTIMLEIEELDGSKYRTFLPTPAGDDFAQLDIAVAELTLGDDSADENGQLDITQVKKLVVGDVSAMEGGPVENTLWLDDVSFAE